MKQKERLLEWLETHESINPLQAWRFLGIYRLSAVIYDLRKEGCVIETERRPVKNRFGEICHVGFYKLVEEKRVIN